MRSVMRTVTCGLSVMGVVCHGGGLSWSWGWSVMREVCHEGGRSWRWSVIGLVFHQGGLMREVSHEGGM